MAGYRKKRLEELIKRIVADTILQEIRDPRIGFVTVTSVKLNKDYSSAEVWVSVIGDEKEKKKTLHGLKSAAGFIQYQIGKEVNIRNTPKVKFCLDNSIESGVEMVNILDKLGNEFFRAPNARQSGIIGTGLGLTVTKQFVDYFQGKLQISSVLNQGTTITVTFPIQQ